MSEIELIAEKLTEKDNTLNVEMSDDEIWFLKNFIKKCNPKKIVEIGVSAGGNTVNILNWKNKDTQLFSVDISTEWYRDKTKLTGFMVEDLPKKDNYKMFRGCDYLDVYKEIGSNIDLIIIDTIHSMPGEFFSFIAALPQLKDGCTVILHDIHLNMIEFSNARFTISGNNAYCNGLLFGSVSSNKKWILKSDMSNIGAFVINQDTRENIKDIFHILCATGAYFPSELNLDEYSKYVNKNYSEDCYNLFKNCLTLQHTYFKNNSNIFKKMRNLLSTIL